LTLSNTELKFFLKAKVAKAASIHEIIPDHPIFTPSRKTDSMPATKQSSQKNASASGDSD